MKRIRPHGFLPYSPIRNSPVPAILHYVQFNGVWNDHSSLLRFGWNSLLCVWMKGIALQLWWIVRNDSENAIWTSSSVILKEAPSPFVSFRGKCCIGCVLPVSVFQYPVLRGDVHVPCSCESIQEIYEPVNWIGMVTTESLSNEVASSISVILSSDLGKSWQRFFRIIMNWGNSLARGTE